MAKTLTLLAALVPIVCIAGTPAHAQDTHFKLYGSAAYVAPMSDSDVTFGSVEDTVKAEKQVGWNMGFEGRFTKWIGLEIDYVHADQDVSFGGSTIGHATFSPLSATFNVHVVHTEVVDFYLGPSYSYVDWGDIHLNASGGGITGSSEIGTESQSTWGASLGLDIGIGKHFVFTGGLRYLDTNLKLNDGQTADVKPLIARLGIGVRF
jgi:hypothetical protein